MEGKMGLEMCLSDLDNPIKIAQNRTTRAKSMYPEIYRNIHVYIHTHLHTIVEGATCTQTLYA